MTVASAGRVVVVSGSPTEDLKRSLAAWGVSVATLGAAVTAESLPDPSRQEIVWLGPRTRVHAELRDAVERFQEGARPRVGVAAHVAYRGRAVVPLGDRVLVAKPGSARLTGAGLLPVAGAETERLACTVGVEAPPRVGQHLQAIDHESTAAAALAALAGDEPTWGALAWRPLVGTLRGWLGATGERNRAFTVAFLESFLAPATAAKLWEARHAEEPPS